jgi:sugar phosphate isomerase/epimerase
VTAVHERVCVNSLCFSGAGRPELAGSGREPAPRRIAFMSHLLPEDLSIPRGIITDGGYRFEGVGHLFLFGKPLEPREETWIPEREKLSRVIDAVAALGGRSIYMLTGGHGDLVWEAAAECFAAAIAPCVAQANDAGIRLMIETTSPLHADNHLAHTLRDTVTLAEMAGIGVCIDIYAVWTEAALKETIARAASRCGHVQVSDYVYGDRSLPSRAVPGDGNIPLLRIVDWILCAGYAGAFDLELIGPRIDAEGHLEATRRAANQVSEILVSLGARAG